MKIVSLFFFFFVIGCKVEDNKSMEEGVKEMFEQLECPINNKPISASN